MSNKIKILSSYSFYQLLPSSHVRPEKVQIDIVVLNINEQVDFYYPEVKVTANSCVVS